MFFRMRLQASLQSRDKSNDRVVSGITGRSIDEKILFASRTGHACFIVVRAYPGLAQQPRFNRIATGSIRGDGRRGRQQRCARDTGWRQSIAAIGYGGLIGLSTALCRDRSASGDLSRVSSDGVEQRAHCATGRRDRGSRRL